MNSAPKPGNPSPDEYNQITDNARLLFGEERSPYLDADEVADLQELRTGSLRRGIAAVYDSYYGDHSVRFRTGPPATDEYRSDDIIDVPPTEWQNWRVVDNGIFVYAEPISTTVFEDGAVVNEPETYIPSLHNELDTCPPEDLDKASDALFKLGLKSMAESGFSEMERGCVERLEMEQSTVRLGASGNSIIIETPGKAGYRTQTTEFSAESVKPANGLYAYQYGEAGIPKAQLRFLARYVAKRRRDRIS